MKYFEIIWEDATLVVCNKKSGVLTVPPRYKTGEKDLFSELAKTRPDLRLIHRIDRDTSGIIAYARGQDSQRLYAVQFEERKVVKKYLAITEGMIPDTGEIETYHQETKPGKYKVSAKGKYCHSQFKVIERWNMFSLVELTPSTGRTHQLRIQMKHIGCPLIVDKLYGNRIEFCLSEIKGRSYRKSDKDERPLLSRHPLHASALMLASKEGEMMKFEALIPKDMKATVYQMRKVIGS